MRLGALLGQIDPNAVIPAAAQLIPGLSPTPDNPLGIPGLGGGLVVPQLPGTPSNPGLPTLPPGQQTDPNNPKVGPLPPGASPASPAANAASATVGIVPVLAAAAGALVIGFLVARVTA